MAASPSQARVGGEPWPEEALGSILRQSAISEGLQFYLSRSEVAAERFVAEFEAALTLLRESPERWPTFHFGTRRFVMAAYPYSIIYRFVEDEIHVIAIAHAKRRPVYWGKRRMR